MRIVAGVWRGRALRSPPGEATRPTADRLRQALFDRLAHAAWAAGVLKGARVLDAFAGTGAMGLEALSRGAAHATFMERDRDALAILHANVRSCGAEAQCRVLPCDVLRPPPGGPCTLAFLDPPYGRDMIAPALQALRRAGWVAPAALVAIETGRTDPTPTGELVIQFDGGAARMTVLRG